RVVDRALALGITSFETADVYGRGSMESTLGARVADKPGTFIITKVGTFRSGTGAGATERVVKRFEPSYLKEAVSRCQERLRRSKIHVVLLHNPAPSTLEGGEAAGVMQELERQGAVGAWGVSAGDRGVVRVALAQGARVIELAYNALFSRDFHDLTGD